jgi:site-specific DNA recombinase
VVYRGKAHRGGHEPIVDQAVFEAVQTRLAASATARQLRLKGSPAILAGRIFDDRGNRMTPTHTNKRGARYRYYVSHALLQKRNDESGSVSRVPAPEIESLVIKALRERFAATDDREQPRFSDDRELIEYWLDHVVIKAQAIEIHFAGDAKHLEGTSIGTASDCDARDLPQTIVTVPWSAATFAEVKGILHSPSSSPTMSSETREALLSAIAKARMWIDDLVHGRVASFSEIAAQEGKVERHIRLLAPLAFVSPQIITAIMDGSASGDLTVTRLAQPLAHSWPEQEWRIRPRTHQN